MCNVNWGRVFLGGLVSWVVFLVFWVAAVFLFLGRAATESWKALGVQAPRGPEFIPFWLVFVYLLGVIALWLYAAIRTRYGPGPTTAVRAGVAVWLIGKVMHTMFFTAVGLFPLRFAAMSTVIDLVCIVAATVAGASLYKEDPATPGV